MSKSVQTYVEYCRVQVQEGPPIANEILALIEYLKREGKNPVVVGSVAVVYHLHLSSSEVEKGEYRPTVDVDIFVSQLPTQVCEGWRVDQDSIGVTSWISPSGGYVDFLEAGHEYPDGQKNPMHLDVDPHSQKLGYPIVDLASLYQLKLNTNREKDLMDMLLLAKRAGFPKGFEKMALNSLQRENLEFIKTMLAHEGG